MSKESQSTFEAAQDQVTLMLDLQFKPESGNEVEQRLAPLIARTRQEEGNLGFQFFRVGAEEGRYVILEHWKNQSALEHHFAQDYFKDVLALFAECLSFPISEIKAHEVHLTELFRTSGLRQIALQP